MLVRPEELSLSPESTHICRCNAIVNSCNCTAGEAETGRFPRGSLASQPESTGPRFSGRPCLIKQGKVYDS